MGASVIQDDTVRSEVAALIETRTKAEAEYRHKLFADQGRAEGCRRNPRCHQSRAADQAAGAHCASRRCRAAACGAHERRHGDRCSGTVEDKLVNLSLGMAVTVEIKTGLRRIISYLLSPLVRYKQEVLRER
jgi:hypothetical protein